MLSELAAHVSPESLDGVADRSVVARLSYVVPGATVPVSYAYEPPAGEPWERVAAC